MGLFAGKECASMSKPMLHEILLLSDSPALPAEIGAWLAQSAFAEARCTVAADCAQGRCALLQQSFDLCIVDAPLPDALGLEFIREFLGRRFEQAILFAEEKWCPQLLDRSIAAGICLLPKPFTRLTLLGAMSVAQAAFSATHSLRRENTELLRRMDALRSIDRAKCLLMQYLGMTEAQAHRYIEKQAMNLRVSKKVIAEHILKTYDN